MIRVGEVIPTTLTMGRILRDYKSSSWETIYRYTAKYCQKNFPKISFIFRVLSIQNVTTISAKKYHRTGTASNILEKFKINGGCETLATIGT